MYITEEEYLTLQNLGLRYYESSEGWDIHEVIMENFPDLYDHWGQLNEYHLNLGVPQELRFTGEKSCSDGTIDFYEFSIPLSALRSEDKLFEWCEEQLSEKKRKEEKERKSMEEKDLQSKRKQYEELKKLFEEDLK